MMMFHSIDETMEMKRRHANERMEILKFKEEKEYMKVFHEQRGEYSEAINKVHELVGSYAGCSPDDFGKAM